ncbi:MAG: ComEC/Rec2 family competence protein [Kiritimatiellaeota bacterium]|nr:ComEC/Rec2 family competence protein [Kiritimatiellota bacterium]
MSEMSDKQAVVPDDELASVTSVIPPRRPICGLAIAGCAGVALGLEFSGEAFRGLAAAGVFALAALLWRRHAVADFLLAAGVACAGWAQASLCAHSPSGREVSALLVRPAEYVTTIGEVRDAPAAQHDERTGEIIWTFPLRLEGLRRVAAWQRAAGEVECKFRLPPHVSPPSCGERWLLTGLLGPHARWRAGGMFPAGYRLTADNAGSRQLNVAHVSVYSSCLRARAKCGALLGRGLEHYPEHAGLLRAMLLGTREEMGEAMYRDFSVTGTLHIIAVSGTHVAVMAVLLLLVLRTAGVTQPYWCFWLAPLLVLYVLMTGLAPSAIRACLMAIVFWLAPLLQRRPDGLTALAWSAILILAWDPTQWLDVGFLLSYAAVLGLLLLYPPLAARIHRLLRTDPWRLQEEAWWRRWPRAAVRYVILLALTSVAVCLVTDALTARYFNLISPVALLANLAVVPAAGLMMTLGVLAMACGAVWAPLADIFNSANLPVISFIMRCVEWSAALSGGHFYFRSPDWWWIAVYYAALILLLIGSRRIRIGVAVTSLLVGGALLWRVAHDRSMAVHVWRLGDATIALVDAPAGDKLLVNTGPRHITRDLLRRMHAEGVGDLRALVLARGNNEHIGGAGDLLRLAGVRELFVASGSARPEVTLAAQRQKITLRKLESGLFVPLVSDAELEVFHPPADLLTRRTADRAPVFRVSRAPLAVLFMSDAGAGAVAQLQARRTVPVASVVLAENATALAPAWLASLGTRDVITQASLLRDVQERQASAEEGGVRLWRLEEGDALHIFWPVYTNQPARAEIIQCPWNSTGPITF